MHSGNPLYVMPGMTMCCQWDSTVRQYTYWQIAGILSLESHAQCRIYTEHEDRGRIVFSVW